MLTIAIPTYNRNNEVVETISTVLPQLSDLCRLLVIDNHSDVSVAESLAVKGVVIEDTPGVRMISNGINVGSQANLLRCIELCDTEWLWILGDDDIPRPDAVKLILNDLPVHSVRTDLTFLNYCSPFHTRDKEVMSTGISEFLESFDDWGQINFTSLCILNATKIKPFLRFGFSYAYSWSCINACLFSCMVERGGTAFFSRTVILSEINKCDDDNKWVPLGPHMGKTILLELLPEQQDKKRLALLMNQKPSLEYIICLIHQLIITTDQKAHYIYICTNLIQRIYYFNTSFLVSLKIRLYSLLLLYPAFGSRIINYFLKRSNRVVKVSKSQFNRL